MTIATTTLTAPTTTAEARAFPGGCPHEVAVAGGQLRVETLGEGPPLLLLHGFTLDRRAWALQAPLAAQVRLIAPDRRGNGQSSAPPGPAAEVADVLAIADALGHRRFALLGHSQGARVAVHAALAAPERVTALLLLGAPIDDAPESLPRDAMRALALAGNTAEMRALWRRHPLMHCDTPAGQKRLDLILADYQARDLIDPHPPLPLTPAILAGLAVPLTVLVGSRDTPERQRAARALAAAAPRARLVQLPGAGHLAGLDAPDLLNAAILSAVAPTVPDQSAGAGSHS